MYIYIRRAWTQVGKRSEQSTRPGTGSFPFGPTPDKVVYRDISEEKFPQEPQAVSDSGGKSGQWQPKDLLFRRRLVNGVLHCGLSYIT